jgi:hypothetical protein
VLTFDEDAIKHGLWHNDLDFVQLSTARMLDVFLDAVLACGATSHSYLLAHGYASALAEEDRTVSNALMSMIDSVPESARSGTAWAAVSTMLDDLGWRTGEAVPSPRPLPEGLR